jgi:hypothetical protein
VLDQVAEGSGGVVVSLATRPASPVRIAGLGRTNLLDDRVWSLLSQDAQEAGPVEQAEAVDQAGRTVAEDSRPPQGTVSGYATEGERWLALSAAARARERRRIAREELTTTTRSAA